MIKTNSNNVILKNDEGYTKAFDLSEGAIFVTINTPMPKGTVHIHGQIFEKHTPKVEATENTPEIPELFENELGWVRKYFANVDLRDSDVFLKIHQELVAEFQVLNPEVEFIIC